MADTQEIRIRGGLYDREEVEKVERWVELAVLLLRPDPQRNARRIALATRLLGDRAQAQIPQLESGERVRLTIGNMRGALDPVTTRPLQDEFVKLTGDVLFAGVDGPHVTANILIERTVKIKERLLNGR